MTDTTEAPIIRDRPRAGSRARDIAFALIAAVLMGLFGLVGAPLALLSAEAGRQVMKAYDRAIFGLLRVMIGVSVRVEGTVPDYPCIVAAKHQSQLDVYQLFEALPVARFVMKAELARVPVFAWYTRRVGCITIDRARPGGTRSAIEALAAVGAETGQIVVYPQGTRIRPGVEAPWRRGAAAIAAELDLPIVPVATNAGHFWSRDGRMAGPGTAIIRFLDPMPADADTARATEALAKRIDAATAEIAAEIAAGSENSG
ncbi:MAG: lysophospholipid acyltransferase family protein [Pseudomonadota bacterium]